MTLREVRMTKYTRQIIISYYSATHKYNPYINGNPNDVLNLKKLFQQHHWKSLGHKLLTLNQWVFIIGDPNVHYFPAGCPMNLSRFSSYSDLQYECVGCKFCGISDSGDSVDGQRINTSLVLGGGSEICIVYYPA